MLAFKRKPRATSSSLDLPSAPTAVRLLSSASANQVIRGQLQLDQFTTAHTLLRDFIGCTGVMVRTFGSPCLTVG